MQPSQAYQVIAAIEDVERAHLRLMTAPNRFAKLAAQSRHKKAQIHLLEHCCAVRAMRVIWPFDEEEFTKHLRSIAEAAITQSRAE